MRILESSGEVLGGGLGALASVSAVKIPRYYRPLQMNFGVDSNVS